MEKISKTNAMRMLDREKIPYAVHTYQSDGAIDGVSVAQKLGIPVQMVFKTLVTKGHSGQHYVFVVPVERELDLKAAASAVKEKSVEMIAVKDLEKTTGYIRGGCSPIGMKKKFPTMVDESCLTLEHMIVSAGKIGLQLELAPADLLQATGAGTAALVHEV